MRGESRASLRVMLAAASILVAGAAECAPNQASLQVSARIQRHASIRMAQPLSLTISEADVARGYVEVSAPVEVLVQSNVQEGYALAFECQGDGVLRAHVHGLQDALMVGSAGARSARPSAGPGLWRETLQLRFRFDLTPQARAGQHAWPLHISMMSQ
jgi:hypothetical protein